MELCLITCNIRFDNPADGQNSWQYRRDFLSRTLLKHRPAIIATQEGRFHQLNELKDLLGDFELIDQHRSWIGERMYPTLFVKNGLFEFLNSGDIWLSETPGVAGSKSFESAFPRLLTWTHLQLKESSHKFLIINTHLDHVKAETRVNQIKVLIQEINKVWDKQSFLIIMGDFNDHPASEVRKLIEDEFKLQDAWRLYNQQEESSHHSFKGAMATGSRIDWIMVDPRSQVKSCLMDKSANQGAYPTDHFPIVCNITL